MNVPSQLELRLDLALYETKDGMLNKRIEKNFYLVEVSLVGFLKHFVLKKVNP